MTTCPRCGLPLRAPVAACSRCGQRFAPPAQPQPQNGFDGSAPTWMRQVQQGQQPQQPQQPQYPPQPGPGAGMYGQRQAAPPQQSPYGQPAARPGFSMNELVSEEALPDWLRQASVESGQPTQRQPIPGTTPNNAPPPYPSAYPPAYPVANSPYGAGFTSADDELLPQPDASAFPSIESAGSYQAPLAGSGGMSASSLLDPNALPSWLGGQPGQAASDGIRSGDGMRAQSLVDDGALPAWMRNEPAAPAQIPVAPPPPAVPGWESYSAATPAAAFSPVAPPAPAVPYAGYGGMQSPVAPVPPASASALTNGQAGFSASQLVDPTALPDWMQAQGAAGDPHPTGLQQPNAPAQSGWSASDLIDPAMLPGWVRGNDPAVPQVSAASSALSAMPPSQASQANRDFGAPRERTAKVPAPRDVNPIDFMEARDSMRQRAAGQAQAEHDFGASRAGTAHRGAISHKHQAALPLHEHEKPAWLRDDSSDEFGQDGRQNRNGQSRNGHGEQSNYGAQHGQPGQDGQRGERSQARNQARNQAGQSWAAPDGFDDSPWSRPRPTRHDRHDRRDAQNAKPAAKKRKGGFFGFLRRG